MNSIAELSLCLSLSAAPNSPVQPPLPGFFCFVQKIKTSTMYLETKYFKIMVLEHYGFKTSWYNCSIFFLYITRNGTDLIGDAVLKCHSLLYTIAHDTNTTTVLLSHGRTVMLLKTKICLVPLKKKHVHKVYVEIREEKLRSWWMEFRKLRKILLFLGKPWYLKKCVLLVSTQTPFDSQYYSIIKYHNNSIVSKLQKNTTLPNRAYMFIWKQSILNHDV